MDGRRSVAVVLVALVFVSVVTASVGAVATPPGEDILGDDGNTTDGTTNTLDETTDTVESVTDGGTTDDDGDSSDAVDDTIDAVDDATSGDGTTVTDGEMASEGETVTDAVTSAESTVDGTTGEVADAVETVDDATGVSDTVRNATNVTVSTLGETADVLSGTLAVESEIDVPLADGGAATGGESGTHEASAAGTAATQRESGGLAREKRRAAAGDETTATAARAAGNGDGSPVSDDRRAPRRLPLPERAAATTAFVAGMVAVARPPVVSQGGVSSLQALASQRLSAGFEDLRRFLVPLGYSRYDDSDPLDHDARAALYDAVKAEPGVYLSELSERAGVNLSTARHHVRVLEDENLVTSAKFRGKRRYYSSTAEDFELAAALSEPATAAVLEALADLGDAHVGRLADELDRDPSTVTHHLQRLADDGLVERERRGRAVVSRLADPVADAVGGHEPAVADD